jgi:hypothetical protein
VRLAQINTAQVQNNIFYELEGFKLLTFRITFCEDFCNPLIPFNINKMNIVSVELYYLHIAPKYPMNIAVIFFSEKENLVTL